MSHFLDFYTYIKKFNSIFRKEIRAAFFSPQLVIKPEGRCILVISPHFDDEIIGCGGTLIKHVLAGDMVSVIYLTDGTNGTPDITNKQEGARIRKDESIAAMRLCDITDLYFLNEVEGHTGVHKETVPTLVSLLQKIKPDLVYLPWFGENHSDHLKTNRIFLDAWKQTKKSYTICAYEVWTPLFPNTIVDIGQEFNKKMEALGCFTSQLKHNDYRRVVSGLNMYNTRYVLKGQSYAEAFLCIPVEQYVELTRSLL